MIAAMKNARSEKRLTARGATMRRRIVAATAKLVEARGAGEISLDDVMAACGASKSQLYHYFVDKEALLREAAGLQVEQVLAAHGPFLEALDSLAAMRRWRDAVMALNRGVGCPLGALAYQLPPGAKAARATVENGFELWRQRIEVGLVRMQARGELAADAAPADLALAVLSAVQGGLLMSRSAKSDRPLAIAFDMALAHVTAQVRGEALSASRREPRLAEPPAPR